MKPIGSEFVSIRRYDVGVEIAQKIVRGATIYLDKRVTLYIPSPKEAIEVALTILEEAVPARSLQLYAERLQLLCDISKKQEAAKPTET